MKKYILLFLIFPLAIIGQVPLSDTTYITDSLDRVDIEEKRNYLGLNITPMMAGIINPRGNYNLKFSALYKRNYRDKNMRISLNHLTEGSDQIYDYSNPVMSTDTSIYNRYFKSNYNYTDFRIGFEELRGFSGARVHVGIDAIMGIGTHQSDYFHKLFIIDSSGNYKLDTLYSPNDQLVQQFGSRTSLYFVTGIDVSFGLDLILNDAFMLTFQITPQFNYYIFRSENLSDPYQEYINYGNYADFQLGYFDFNLIYKF